LLKAAEKAGVNALTPVIGESRFYGESSVISKWEPKAKKGDVYDFMLLSARC
jgi:hypothetical protein